MIFYKLDYCRIHISLVQGSGVDTDTGRDRAVGRAVDLGSGNMAHRGPDSDRDHMARTVHTVRKVHTVRTVRKARDRDIGTGHRVHKVRMVRKVHMVRKDKVRTDIRMKGIFLDCLPSSQYNYVRDFYLRSIAASYDRNSRIRI